MAKVQSVSPEILETGAFADDPYGFATLVWVFFIADPLIILTSSEASRGATRPTIL